MYPKNLLRAVPFLAVGTVLIAGQHLVEPARAYPFPDKGIQFVDRTIQDAGDSNNVKIGPQQLTQALARLKKCAATDAALKADYAALSEMLQRVAANPAEASPHELSVFRTFLEEDPSDTPNYTGEKDIKASVVHRLHTQIHDWPQYAFQSASRRWPDGSHIGVIKLLADGTTRTEVEVVSNAGGRKPTDRVVAIVQRLSQLQHANRYWWSQLRAVPKGKDTYVTAPGVEGGVIITADSKFAQLMDARSTGQAAHRLIQQIRKGVDPPRVDPNEKDISPDGLRDAAIKSRQSGDEAYSNGDVAGAEQNYKDAIDASPHYVIPYLRLSELYLHQNSKEKAKAILVEALKLPNLPADDQRLLQSTQAAIK